ncbi:platelet glycoprotein V [Orussus abietinus]|uniref:platelet glycoprotein V n=1 Tax=Orussus abietinus TaxID=222816 RepID=UPI000625D21F|nr:platelet glycoprotein V [Orussus abietinus]
MAERGEGTEANQRWVAQSSRDPWATSARRLASIAALESPASPCRERRRRPTEATMLQLVVLALVASTYACSESCRCSPLRRKSGQSRRALVEVSCFGKAPAWCSLPADLGGLRIHDAREFGATEECRGRFRWVEELAVTNCSGSAFPGARIDFEGLRAVDPSRGHFSTPPTPSTLRRLSLRANAISSVDGSAFVGLARLEELDLSENELSSLPSEALAPLAALERLDLGGNRLRVLGTRWFSGLRRLRELDVSRNGLTRTAPGEPPPLPGLSVLRLAGNPLRERDVSLLLGTGQLLETVDASRTGLARVPAALTRSVRALRLAGNALTAIRGGDLDSYPLLRSLDVSGNRLTDVEEDALGRLEVLEELDASGNALREVPRSLPASLRALGLAGNAIARLRRGDLQGLSNLRTLILSDNAMDAIEEGAFARAAVLAELDVSNNSLKVVTPDTLAGLSGLAVLRMAGLTSLEWTQRGDMAFPMPTPERLVLLDVSRSPVLAAQLLADDAALSACKSLAELHLGGANLTRLRSDLADVLPQLRTLELHGNAWDCGADLSWLGEWIRRHEEIRPPAECARGRTFLFQLRTAPPLPGADQGRNVSVAIPETLPWAVGAPPDMPYDGLALAVATVAAAVAAVAVLGAAATAVAVATRRRSKRRDVEARDLVPVEGRW